MQTISFFDTETTGVPKNYKAPPTDLENWPRIIQLAWQVADANTGERFKEHKYLIKPDGWVVPKEKFWIDNGFSTEKNEAEGKPLPQVIDWFISDYLESDALVAHNMAFDFPILAAEMIRYGKGTNGRRLPKFCTMEASVEVCKLPNHNGWKGYKWPKLQELYKHLFKLDFEGGHDAGNDVTACRLCFFELVKMGVIKLPNQP